MAVLVAFSAESVMIPGVGVFLVGVLITLPTSWLLALPLALWLRRVGLLNAILLCLIGSVVGAIVFGLFILDINYYPQIPDKAHAIQVAEEAALSALVPGALYGFLSATAMCVGAGIKIRPNRRRLGAG
jgi:hypothetical protein